MYDKRLDDCEHCRRPQEECICKKTGIKAEDVFHHMREERISHTVQEIEGPQCCDTDETINNGGSTHYYQLPEGAKELQDLIEAQGMNFAQGNIFKAIYRRGGHSEYERDLNKIIFFAERELKRIKRGTN